MIIIETCPECGADLYEDVIDTYPPIKTKRCTKCHWKWTEPPEEVVRVPFVPPGEKRETITWPRRDWNDGGNEYMFGWVPECCRGCSNHPSNGGSGVCMCTLPYMTWTGSRNTSRGYTVDTTATMESHPNIVVSDHT